MRVAASTTVLPHNTAIASTLPAAGSLSRPCRSVLTFPGCCGSTAAVAKRNRSRDEPLAANRGEGCLAQSVGGDLPVTRWPKFRRRQDRPHHHLFGFHAGKLYQNGQGGVHGGLVIERE